MLIKNNNLIIFFIPPKQEVNGGILSIFSIASESRKFFNIHKSKVIISVFPGEKSYRKNYLFDNDENIYDFDEVLRKHTKINKLIMNIPEYAVDLVSVGLISYIDKLKEVKDIQINILNQNIELMPERLEIAKLFSFTDKVTQTTAHDRYCSQENANYYGIPTHHLSTFIDEKKYKKTQFENKKNIILISNDRNTHKNKIINEITKGLPTFEVRVIENLKYENYKKLISESKYVITFGEGFDGYFVEPYFCGSISFAVYNDEFFPTKDYKYLPNVYKSFDEMKDKIVKDIKKFEKSKKNYKDLSKFILDKINEKYGHNKYVNNIKMFYYKKYTFLPSEQSVINYNNDYIKKSHLTDIKSIILKTEIAKKESLINDLNSKVSELKKELKDIKKSKSWLITKPLRNISQQLKRGKK